MQYCERYFADAREWRLCSADVAGGAVNARTRMTFEEALAQKLMPFQVERMLMYSRNMREHSKVRESMSATW